MDPLLLYLSMYGSRRSLVALENPSVRVYAHKHAAGYRCMKGLEHASETFGEPIHSGSSGRIRRVFYAGLENQACSTRFASNGKARNVSLASPLARQRAGSFAAPNGRSVVCSLRGLGNDQLFLLPLLVLNGGRAGERSVGRPALDRSNGHANLDGNSKRSKAHSRGMICFAWRKNSVQSRRQPFLTNLYPYNTHQHGKQGGKGIDRSARPVSSRCFSENMNSERTNSWLTHQLRTGEREMNRSADFYSGAESAAPSTSRSISQVDVQRRQWDPDSGFSNVERGLIHMSDDDFPLRERSRLHKLLFVSAGHELFLPRQFHWSPLKLRSHKSKQ